jgi:hypothetical protein
MAFNLVRYSQQDPLWKNDKIGGGPDTIGYIGCALTCVAMYTSGWGYTETPGSLNKKLTAHGGFINEAIVWGAVSGLYPQIKSTGLTVCTNSDAPLAPIDASLAIGQPVIVEVDFSPAAGLQTHWVLVYAKQGSDYLMLDPWPFPSDTKDVTLMSRFSQGKSLQRAIKAVAWYQFSGGGPGGTPSGGTPSGSTTTTPSTPAPTPVETDLFVQVVASATAGIKLHTQASLDSPANFAEMPGTQLHVIEDKAAALAKLGQNNQWLYVRDPNGQHGYVAAWYVAKVGSAAPVPTPPTPTPSTPPPPASAPQRFQVVVLPSVGAGGLLVRQQPSQGAALVNKEKAGARLTVIEPHDSAMRKIGVAGQWIAVKATNNKTGYIMAQYVQVKS